MHEDTKGNVGHWGTEGTGTHGDTGMGVCGDTESSAVGRSPAGPHRVSSGSDSGSRVLGFCSIHRNSIKERPAPAEWAPPPLPRAGGPRREGGGLRCAPHGAHLSAGLPAASRGGDLHRQSMLSPHGSVQRWTGVGKATWSLQRGAGLGGRAAGVQESLRQHAGCAEGTAAGLHAACNGVQGQRAHSMCKAALSTRWHAMQCMVQRAQGVQSSAERATACNGVQGTWRWVGAKGTCKNTWSEQGLAGCTQQGWVGAQRCARARRSAQGCARESGGEQRAGCARVCTSVQRRARACRTRAQPWVQVCMGRAGAAGASEHQAGVVGGTYRGGGRRGLLGTAFSVSNPAAKRRHRGAMGGGTPTLPPATTGSSSSHRRATPQRHPPAPSPPPASPQRHRGGPGSAQAPLQARPVWGRAAVEAPHPPPVGAVPGPGAAARCGAGQKVGHVCLGGGRNSSGGFRARRRCSRPDPPDPPGPPSIWGTRPRCRQIEGCCARGCAVPPFAALEAPGGGGGGGSRDGSDPPTARRGIWGRSSRPGFGAVRGRYLRSAAGGCSKCLFHMGTPRRHFQV